MRVPAHELAGAAAGALLAAVLLLAPQPAAAAPFQRGQMTVGLALGGGSGLGGGYFVLGGSFGYFVLDGLELAASGQVWLGSSPFVSTVSPRVTYVFYFVPVVHPYAGFIYRHWFIASGRTDLDMLGGRGGAYFELGRNAYLGAGVAYERAVSSCEGDCDVVYPEVAFGFSF